MTRTSLAAVLFGGVLAVGSAVQLAAIAAPPVDGHGRSVPHGRLDVVQGCSVLTLDGSPEEMGVACGKLLGPTVRRVVRDMITEGIGKDPEAYRNILAGSRVMAEFQPQEFLAEVRALAAAAEVSHDDLLLLQYFGDVRRCIKGPGSSSLCTSIAMLPPLVQGRRCIVARNLDYFDHGVGDYASILVHYRPKGRIPFVTVTWAGIINGWTLMNTRGIVVSNNTAFGAKSQSLQGISTCFLLRHVAERAATLDQAVEMVQRAARACGTSMLVASGDPPDAAIIEFDHQEVVIRRPDNGFVGAANGFEALYREADDAYAVGGRVATALAAARALAGQVDVNSGIASAPGVPIEGMNLHSAMLDATERRLRVSMGAIPAFRLPARSFRLTEADLVADVPTEGAALPPLPARPPARERQAFGVMDALALAISSVIVFFVVLVMARLARSAFTGRPPVTFSKNNGTSEEDADR